jgi:protein-tyrosine-phosphatase
MAEAIFNHFAKRKHISYSAGTLVYDEKEQSKQGQKIKELKGAEVVVHSLRALGLDVSEKQRDQITPEMVREANKIVVMAEKHTIPDFLRQSSKVIYWDIENPKGMDQGDTDKVRDKITSHVKELLLELNK